MQKLLVVRGYNTTRYLLITLVRLKQKGLLFVIKKIFSRAKTKLTRTIVTTSSGSESVMAEVLYKRK